MKRPYEVFSEQIKKEYPEQADRILKQFEDYHHFLVEENEKINLTAITEKEAVYEKHFMDSLTIAHQIPSQSNVADVGSGAGFPGICLAIVRDDCHFDLIEPIGKRCRFLKELKERLDLKNVTVHQGRIEDIGKKEQYDVVTSRAVAQLSVLLELCVPYVKIGGRMIAMKGSQALEELKKATDAMLCLNLDQPEIQAVSMISAGERFNLIYLKGRKTPDQYPRPYAMIKKKELRYARDKRNTQ